VKSDAEFTIHEGKRIFCLKEGEDYSDIEVEKETAQDTENLNLANKL